METGLREVDLLHDTAKVETGLQKVDLLTQQSGDRTARSGSADATKVETGLREVDVLTRQKWRQDCERWIC